MTSVEQVLERIKEVLKEELGYEDAQIVAIVASPSKEEAWQLYEFDDDYLNLMLGELEYLKNKLALLHFFEEVQEDDSEEAQAEEEVEDEKEQGPATPQPLPSELATDRGVLRLKDWFAEQHADLLARLQNSKVERETEKAIMVKSGELGLWIPKSVIVEGLQ